MSRSLLALLTAWLLMTAHPQSPRAAGLVADLSDHLIAITTAFAGSDVLLFGATDGGGDVVVVVRGPAREQTVWRKRRIAGIWVNADSVTFGNVPSYYAIASSRPLDEVADEATLVRHGLGLSVLPLPVVDASDAGNAEVATFREALFRNKQDAGLYTVEPAPIVFLGERLFRTTLWFPANVAPGSYQVQVFQFRDGIVVGAQSSVLIISKVGLEADIFDFAHNQARVYGIVAVIIALMSGWVVGVVFRRN